MRNVIVIGANGFLGRNLAVLLAQRGYNVLALVRDAESFSEKEKGLQCRAFTFDTLSDIVVRGYDTIFNMAWSGVGAAYNNEPAVQVQNISYSLKVLEFAKRNEIRRVIVPGSAAEASCGQGAITGNEAPAPSDIYSAAKVASRYLCRTYARQHNIELIWTLITSIYGPGRDDNNIISYTVRTLLEGGRPSYTGLEQQWDFLYVDDLMEALIALGEKGVAGKVYPVGSGESRRLRDYVCTLRDMINPELPLGIGERPYKNPGKIDNQIMDISELVRDTGFTPKVSFEDGAGRIVRNFLLK